ncbi:MULTISPECIES: GNAT family N-acetyltransferase [Streptomyces]|uniref:GNAT family N-acetyltransferase n=2 Tax=Streptomyces TaxID=1883 RepID=A0ABS9JGD6_9ACTN|nr:MULTISPECIES: GNAT family N-acetyltransferase [Streptomyces]MCG0064622.1 GNAT family N-acetyltransferase [Streptomyces tricolor]OYP18632.1 N-acetyltransferase [Streptomyces sp. FBKL.4005]BCM71338.1 putative acetyltransferase [Streptomyces sp. EAS-AB2608]CUW27289.1 Acetyltransferase (GNAT) family protein [Streptomyces reticuli]
MSDAPDLPEGYEFSADPARVDVDRVHGWLSSDTYWATGRPRETHERAMASSLNYGVYDTVSGEQVAYARVVTDRALFAWLADVYVDPSVRGKGVGTAFVGRIRDHLAPFGLRRVLLATEDAHGVYEKLGFRPLDRPDQWMVHTFE